MAPVERSWLLRCIRTRLVRIRGRRRFFYRSTTLSSVCGSFNVYSALPLVLMIAPCLYKPLRCARARARASHTHAQALKSLRLGGNVLGFAGNKAMATLLKVNTVLEELASSEPRSRSRSSNNNSPQQRVYTGPPPPI